MAMVSIVTQISIDENLIKNSTVLASGMEKKNDRLAFYAVRMKTNRTRVSGAHS